MTRGISLLVSPEMRTLAHAVRQLPAEVNKEIRKHTKTAITPIWQESVLGNVQSHIQTRVLSDTARVSVSDRNVNLRAGGVGKLSSGTPSTVLAYGVEFGSNPKKIIQGTSRKGLKYNRRMGNKFGPPRRGGYVVHQAAYESIARAAALWIQTAVRTVHEVFERGGLRGR